VPTKILDEEGEKPGEWLDGEPEKIYDPKETKLIEVHPLQ